MSKNQKNEGSGVYFRPDHAILQDGIYRVFHAGHRMSHEVTLLAGEKFPRCVACGTAVHYELLRTAHRLEEDPEFRIHLYALPHPQREKRKAKAKAKGK